MTTVAHNVVAKLSVAFVAVAMLFTMVSPAKAATAEEMQQMINDLLAQVAALQGSTGGGSGAAMCPYTWTRSLKTGDTGMDVMKLQQFLNSDADTRVSASGVGSAGMETEYFGPATAAAVSKFQVKYRSDVLSPAGLVNPTGYFGPASMAKANMLCVAGGTTGGGDDMSDDSDDDMSDDDDDMSGDLSGEASLDTAELEEGESSIEEDETDVVVGEFNVEFEDGDAEISRIDVALVGDGSGAEPWEAFDTISLWVDGEMVAEADASDEDEYLDEDAGEMRFTGLDIVAMEGDELTISIAVSTQDNLDAAELDNWTLTVESMRFFDADGVATTENDPADGDEAEFDIDVAGADEELKISLASSNPDATDIVVDTDSDTNDVTIMVGELEAEDSDIELNTIVVKVETTGATTTNVVDEIRVVIDGEEFEAEAIGSEVDALPGTNGTGNGLSEGYSEASSTLANMVVWYLFDIDGDVVIDEDSEVEMEVIVDFNDTDDGARYDNGVTIEASVTSVERAYWDAEGADDLGSGQISGTAVGDEHTLVAEGILVPVDGFSSETDTLGTNDTIGEFVLEFEVTAVEGDFYITEEATTSTAAVEGVVFTVDGGSATVSGTLTSTADEDTPGVFTVREGETKTFTLTVTVDPAATGAFRVTLSEIWYSDDADGVTGALDYLPTPASDYRTASQSIQGS
jgi:hypothetical protein